MAAVAAILLFAAPSLAGGLAGNDLIAYVRANAPSVAVAPGASATVRGAAAELAATISEMTGTRVDVVAGTTANAGWFVGANIAAPDFDSAAAWIAANPDAAAEGDAYAMVDHDGVTYLTGASDRATAYAVYDYEENSLGVRWYAPDDTVIPHPDRLIIPPLDKLVQAAYSYRDTCIFVTHNAAAWDAHMRLDGENTPDMGAYGGQNRFCNGAENFYGLVPPDKYFATHPEYYSLIDGVRSDADRSQLCLTNSDVFNIVVDGLVDQANQDKTLPVLGLSPNDADAGYCQCDNCRAADAKFGGPSGTVLDFVNRVAAAVQQRLPDRKIYVEMLAYLYTEPPPTVKPADNVIIYWAPLSADVGHGVADGIRNRQHMQTLLGWERLVGHQPGQPPSARFQVWHYAANFSHFLQPLPDWSELQEDMRLYRDHGVSGIFIEGDYAAPGDMDVLRSYVVGHLLWNPDQDIWKLIDDFCNGYYGPGAGPWMVRYLREFEKPLVNPDVKAGIYDNPNRAPYLAPAIVAGAQLDLDHAMREARTAVQRDRIAQEALGLREIDLDRTRPDAGATAAVKQAYRTKLDAFVADLHRYGVTYMGEDYPTDSWIANMQAP